MSTLADYRVYPLQLGRLAADPVLVSLGIDPARVAAFVAAELDRLDPASARIAEVEARWSASLQAPDTVPGHIIDPVRGVIAVLLGGTAERLEIEELGPAYTVEQAERWARDVWQARRAAPVMRKAS